MCGIFGYIGNDKKSNWSLDKFNMLGIFNDSRGGDSTGFFIDGVWEVGADKLKLFSDFLIGNVSLQSFYKSSPKIALGHCRKASVGGKTIDEAQPVIITNDNNSNNKKLCLIHNGTICNYKELALKHGYSAESIKGWTDSQVMALLLDVKGPSILEEYIGAGAFVWYDYKDNNVYVFKGASREKDWSKEITEERPLFYYAHNSTIYFSSIEKSLACIKGDVKNIESFKNNTLYTIKNGVIINTKLIDRDKKELYQIETYRTASTVCGYGHWHNKRSYDNSSIGITNKKDKDFIGCSEHKENKDGNYTNNFVKPLGGLYMRGTIPAEGVMRVNEYGYIQSSGVSTTTETKQFVFFEGHMIKSEKDLIALQYLRKIQNKEEVGLSVDEIAPFAVEPIWDAELEVYFAMDKSDKEVGLFDGNLIIYFSHEVGEYKIELGSIKAYKKAEIETVNKPFYKKYKQDLTTKVLKEDGEIKEYLIENIKYIKTL